MDLHLADRTVLVTGGSSGVGLATVATLLEEGANVITCARRPDVLEKALADLGAPADRVLAMSCDVRDAGQVRAVVEAGAARFGGIDGLVNNAGQSRMLGLDQATVDDFRDELDLKFGGVLNVTGAALPHLRASDAAAIVTINAVLARQPEPRLVTTSAARAGLLNLTKSMASEYAPDIRVNSVCLGLIDTGQWRRRFEADENGTLYEAFESDLAADRGISLGRFGRAEEVAAMVVTLLSPRASYVTGAALDVCGGVARYVA
ncbi:SDR family oxidoreductase [Nocardioides sp. KC13]|uniref:SDR family oxidoreductase n=1 Tax=Nocardioides turkmenicus TaxID=2711220 RepID=A0A6M1QXM8_9ACTN|nr:SDR family oxidoreductase [Nocardioides sp. KC13]NGN91171.1 SDR family oxidoreductase [Nocardioides sp. KC13]